MAKDDEKFLPRFLSQLEQVDYPVEKLRHVWLIGKSKDNTEQIILDWYKTRNYTWEAYREPVYFKPINSSIYLSKTCNYFKQLYKGEDFVWFLDTDVVYLPRDILRQLVSVDKDIVAPYVFIEGTDRFFDTYCFRYRGWKFEYAVIDGKQYNYRNPPFKDSKVPVELDSVGTCILIKKEVFLDIDWEDPVPHLQFCWKARKKGYKVYALPYVRIYHADVEKEGDPPHFPVEYYVQIGMLPEEELPKVGMVKKGKLWVLKTW